MTDHNHPLYETWNALRRDGSTRMTFAEYLACTDPGHVTNESGSVHCATCGEMIDPESGTCTNVGSCYAADVAAVPSPGDRMKSPQAFTIRGNVD